jgi:hypothetical protein
MKSKQNKTKSYYDGDSATEPAPPGLTCLRRCFCGGNRFIGSHVHEKINRYGAIRLIAVALYTSTIQQLWTIYNKRVMTPSPCRRVRYFLVIYTGNARAFVFPSRNKSFMPSLMNSGCETNSNCTVARSPVRSTPCG